MEKKELQEKINKLHEELKPLEEQLREINRQEAETCEDRIKLCHRLKYKFEPKELRYSRTQRCACGAGLAYPLCVGPTSSWHCGAILTGTADTEKQHDSGFPFSMYEIKSENETQTTRP